MASSDHIVYSNFYSRNDITKMVFLVQGKNLLIDALRNIFANDDLYRYRHDQYGFPLIPGAFGLPVEEGGTQRDIDGNFIPANELSTKILITSTFRQDVAFWPVITVRQSGGRNHPISFNQNAIQVHYRKEIIRDGYGNQIEVRTPTHFVFGDAWDQSFEIKIVAEDLVDRDQIVDIVSIGLMHSKRDELRRAGLFIKDISVGGEAEEENVKHTSKWLYTCVITVNTYSEWSREIPIRNVIERINFYFDVASSGIQPSGETDVLDGDLWNGATLIAIIP